jgi:hypothetical protein
MSQQYLDVSTNSAGYGRRTSRRDPGPELFVQPRKSDSAARGGHDGKPRLVDPVVGSIPTNATAGSAGLLTGRKEEEEQWTAPEPTSMRAIVAAISGLGVVAFLWSIIVLS